MKHIIFDFDGTIADSFEETLAVFELVTKRKTPLTPELVADLRTQSMRDVLRALGLHVWQVPALLSRGRQLMAERIIDIEPFPGLEAAFKQLRHDGHTLHIMSTNNPDNIHKFLRARGLEQYFEHVLGNVGLMKSRALRKLMRQLRAVPTDCVYVGDETRDIDAAHAAHMDVLAVAWGFNAPSILAAHRPTAMVGTPAELADGIKALSRT